jgi:hydroxyacylglutathione hydrolase
MSIKIYTIKLSISNCYLVTGEKNILIDTGSPNEGQKIIKAIQKLGLQLSDISLILHTHGHSDHCGSTKELLNICKIPTAIHIADSEMVASGINTKIKYTKFISRFIWLFVDKPFTPFTADIKIENNFDLNTFGINGKVYHTKGHTKGSIAIEFDNGAAIIGDTLMGGYFGGLVLPHLPDFHYFADDLSEVKLAIQKILSFNSTTFYVGHGGPLSKKDINSFIAKKGIRTLFK